MLKLAFAAVAAESVASGITFSLLKDNTIQTALHAGLQSGFMAAAGTYFGALIGDKLLSDGTDNETSFIGKGLGGAVGFVIGSVGGIFLNLR